MKRWRLFTVFPVGRAAKDSELQLSNGDFRGVMEFIKRTRKEGRIKTAYGCEGFLGNYEGDVRDYFFHCQAGVSVGSVLVDGAISACPSIRADYHQGNIYEDDFMEVWNNKYRPYRDREWMRKGECADCKFSVIAKETVCICVTGMGTCCFAIIKGCKHYKTREYEHEKENCSA